VVFDKLFGDGEVLDIDGYSAEKFPSDFGREMIDKIARAEHNRWNAFHYLGGWSYNPEEREKQERGKFKEHDCLILIEEFQSERARDSYRYDLASVYYIPVYLAKSGYGVGEV